MLFIINSLNVSNAFGQTNFEMLLHRVEKLEMENIALREEVEALAAVKNFGT